MKWVRQGNVVAWPYGWQWPNKTEKWAYEQKLSESKSSEFSQVLFFPWATLIDLLRNKKYEKARPYLDALRWAPPKTTLMRSTVMQHIWAKDMLPYLIELGVTDIYWSHATKNELFFSTINVHPYLLYPVCCADCVDPDAGLLPMHRRYIYSFIGAYDPNIYISQVRRWIFDLAQTDDAFVVQRKEWHYQEQVYGIQVEDKCIDAKNSRFQTQKENEYRDILSQSIFSLCPSGAGPNSIRLWESLGMGCIPVILADDLRLMGDISLWKQAAIFVPETPSSVRDLPAMLGKLAKNHDYLIGKRMAALQLWRKYVSGDDGSCFCDVL